MSSTDKSENNISVSTDQQNSTVPISEMDQHSHSCNDPTHHHNMPSYFDQNDLFSTLTAAKTETPAKRKTKKNPKQGVIRAELIPGNRGNENIDDLVNFINSPSPANDNKQKKKSTTAN
jgi:hypothetical protein